MADKEEGKPLNTFNNPQAMLRKMMSEGKADIRQGDAPFQFPTEVVDGDEEGEEEEEGVDAEDGADEVDNAEAEDGDKNAEEKK